MSQPVPEERNDADILQPGDTPPGEHDSDLPGEADAPGATAEQDENAGTTLDQPSQ